MSIITSYNQFLNEGYLDPVSPTRLQKKVDEVNELIRSAVDDFDNAPLEVYDNTSTWQAGMKFKPFRFEKNCLYSEYEEYTGHKPEIKKEKFKASESFDAYQWLNLVAKWYRAAIKKYTIDK